MNSNNFNNYNEPNENQNNNQQPFYYQQPSEPVPYKDPSKGNKTLLYTIIAVIAIAIIGVILYFVFKPKTTTPTPEPEPTPTPTVTTDGELTEDEYKSMVKQELALLEENVNKFYKQVMARDNKYTVDIDYKRIKYTDEYSEDGEKYYVVTATSKDSSGSTSDEFLVRCQWDKDNQKITKYADNSKTIMVLKSYEYVTKGYFFIEKSQYKNDKLWSDTTVNADNVLEVFNDVDKLIYIHIDYVQTSDQNALQETLKLNSEYMKKILKAKYVYVLVAQVETTNEASSKSTISNYITGSMKNGEDSSIELLQSYLKSNTKYLDSTVSVN